MKMKYCYFENQKSGINFKLTTAKIGMISVTSIYYKKIEEMRNS